jgi:hypothetical protein
VCVRRRSLGSGTDVIQTGGNGGLLRGAAVWRRAVVEYEDERVGVSVGRVSINIRCRQGADISGRTIVLRGGNG